MTYSVLAACAGVRAYAWPEQDYLAKRVSASVRSVQRYLGELTRRGLIAVSRESVKGKRRCLYSFPGSEPGLERGGDKMPPGSEKRLEPPAAEATDCQVASGNLSCSLN